MMTKNRLNLQAVEIVVQLDLSRKMYDSETRKNRY